MQDTPEDKAQDPLVSLPERDELGEAPPGVDRPPVSVEPGQKPVQLHVDVACPLLLLILVAKVIIHGYGGNRP